MHYHEPTPPSVALLEAFLDSLKDPFVFVDTSHTVVAMNTPAITHYAAGEALLGTSIFDCHSRVSNETIRAVFARMEAGLDEALITDDQRHRIYMRAVRAVDGTLLGYYERYEPPRPTTTTTGDALP